MTLEYRQIPETNILEFTLDGGFTLEDFEKLRAEAERMIERHGRVRLLKIIRSFGSVQPAAIWENLKFGPRHLKHFSHVAVAADKKWIEWISAASRPFVPMQTRCFHLDQLDEARRWLAEQPEEEAAKD